MPGACVKTVSPPSITSLKYKTTFEALQRNHFFYKTCVDQAHNSENNLKATSLVIVADGLRLDLIKFHSLGYSATIASFPALARTHRSKSVGPELFGLEVVSFSALEVIKVHHVRLTFVVPQHLDKRGARRKAYVSRGNPIPTLVVPRQTKQAYLKICEAHYSSGSRQK